MFEHDVETKSRLLAKIVRELLVSDTFDSLTDLTEALKRLCGRRRIRWTPDDIGNAFRLIASNRELISSQRILEPVAVVPPRDLQRAEAARIYREIMDRYAGARAVAAAQKSSDRPADFPDLVRVRVWT